VVGHVSFEGPDTIAEFCGEVVDCGVEVETGNYVVAVVIDEPFDDAASDTARCSSH
jgi:hypothetical protein